MSWLKYTILCMRRNLSAICLLALIALAIFLYFYAGVKLELLAFIFPSLFTLLILPIVEKRKQIWSTKYETFKFLYASRRNIVNYDVVRHLNIIDIVFINDCNVRKCWKELLAILHDRSSNDATDWNQKVNTRLAELIKEMAICLGLNKDISFVDINETYYPNGLGDIDEKMRTKDYWEMKFYYEACNFLDDCKKRQSNYHTDDNSQQPS